MATQADSQHVHAGPLYRLVAGILAGVVESAGHEAVGDSQSARATAAESASGSPLEVSVGTGALPPRLQASPLPPRMSVAPVHNFKVAPPMAGDGDDGAMRRGRHHVVDAPIARHRRVSAPPAPAPPPTRGLAAPDAARRVIVPALALRAAAPTLGPPPAAGAAAGAAAAAAVRHGARSENVVQLPAGGPPAADAGRRERPPAVADVDAAAPSAVQSDRSGPRAPADPIVAALRAGLDGLDALPSARPLAASDGGVGNSGGGSAHAWAAAAGGVAATLRTQRMARVRAVTAAVDAALAEAGLG